MLTSCTIRKGNKGAFTNIRQKDPKAASYGDTGNAATWSTSRRVGSNIQLIAMAVRELAQRQARLQDAAVCAVSDSHDQLLQVCIDDL